MVKSYCSAPGRFPSIHTAIVLGNSKINVHELEEADYQRLHEYAEKYHKAAEPEKKPEQTKKS